MINYWIFAYLEPIETVQLKNRESFYRQLIITSILRITIFIWIKIVLTSWYFNTIFVSETMLKKVKSDLYALWLRPFNIKLQRKQFRSIVNLISCEPIISLTWLNFGFSDVWQYSIRSQNNCRLKNFTICFIGFDGFSYIQNPKGKYDGLEHHDDT